MSRDRSIFEQKSKVGWDEFDLSDFGAAVVALLACAVVFWLVCAL